MLCILSGPIFSQSTADVELSISVDSTGKSQSCIKGNFHGTLIIQQFRWNMWCNVDTLGYTVDWKDTCIEQNIRLHSGENQLRLLAKPTNPYVDPSYSAIVKTTTTIQCNFTSKCNGLILFGCITYWEIHNDKNELVESGNSDRIKITDLPKGGYYLYYDNSMAEFFTQ